MDEFDVEFIKIILKISGVCIAVIIIACAIAGCFNFGFDNGTGQQIGYISEVETNGMIWHTTEITLLSVVPTYSDSDTMWKYSPADPAITQKAQEALKNHDKVIVDYDVRTLVWGWQYTDRTIITNITVEVN